MNDITFQRKLISIMKDNMFDRFVANKKSGKLNTKKLYKIDTSNKLFKKKEERKGKHYNITVLVDCSGSMSRSNRYLHAGKAVSMLTENLSKAKLNFQVLGFNSDLFTLLKFNQKIDKDTVVKIEKEIIKRIDGSYQPYSKYVKETGELYQPEFHSKEYSKIDQDDHYDLRAGNFDGYYINEVVRQVSNLKGKNILIVLSDGIPHHDYGDFYIPNTNQKKKYLEDYPLKKVVKSAIDKSIVFLGIGIQTEAVRSYYPEKNTIVVNDLDNLYGDIVGKLQGLIKRG